MCAAVSSLYRCVTVSSLYRCVTVSSLYRHCIVIVQSLYRCVTAEVRENREQGARLHVLLDELTALGVVGHENLRRALAAPTR
eukprot:348847-Prorocentrum_minimum.AAC.1